MKANMTKRIFGIALALVMLMAILPTAALAAEDDVTVYLKPSSNWLEGSPRFAVYYFDANGGSGWVDMTADGEYYTAVVPANVTIIFCRMNPAATENDWNNKWNQTSDLALPSDNKNCYATEEGAWDKGNGVWIEKGQDPTFTPVDDYYCIAGTAGLCGVAWDAGATNPNKMTEVENGKYQITFETVPAGEHKFKVSFNNWAKDWGDNGADYVLNLTEASNVTITFDVASETIHVDVVASEKEPEPQPEKDYFLAGSAGLCGNNWDANPDTAKKLVKNDDGKYEITLPEIEAGSYEFKVTLANWGQDWGQNGGNASVTVETLSNVTVTFDPATGSIEVSVAAIVNPDTGDSLNGMFLGTVLALAAMAWLVLAKKKFF